jgi:hypothetical protein
VIHTHSTAQHTLLPAVEKPDRVELTSPDALNEAIMPPVQVAQLKSDLMRRLTAHGEVKNEMQLIGDN